ncbi:MAG: DUF4126 domain-containing protein [Candidatus Omnitrophica bacterium]|nr:DUF4126 domain-containing protein [Candidatus Omnitrophota bacterium]
MEFLNSTGLLLGGSWASGVNLYLTAAGLGIAHRFHWVTLPGELEILAHPLVIAVAIIIYLIEFFADKIPYVDSLWDSFHTIIRPAGGAALGYLAMSEAGPAARMAASLVTGSIAMDSHLTKAASRAAINTSPEPVTNSVASVTEDISVVGILVLIARHPVIASLLVIAFLVFSIWFLKKMFRFVKRVFTPARKPRADDGTKDSDA